MLVGEEFEPPLASDDAVADNEWTAEYEGAIDSFKPGMHPMRTMIIVLSLVIAQCAAMVGADEPKAEQAEKSAKALLQWAARLYRAGDVTSALAAQYSADKLMKKAQEEAAEPANVQVPRDEATIPVAADRDDSIHRDLERRISLLEEGRVDEVHENGRHEDAETIERVARALFERLARPEREGRDRERARGDREVEEEDVKRDDRERDHHPDRERRTRHDGDHPRGGPHHERRDDDERHERRRPHHPPGEGPPEAREMEERLMHLREAVMHLHAAGLHEPAERIGHMAEEMRRQSELARAVDEARRAHGGPHPMGPGLPHELEDLRREVRELHERLDRLEGEHRRQHERRER